jgi:hypothetical protein
VEFVVFRQNQRSSRFRAELATMKPRNFWAFISG